MNTQLNMHTQGHPGRMIPIHQVRQRGEFHSHTVSVAKYVLPKFSVSIENNLGAKTFLANAVEMPIRVCAS